MARLKGFVFVAAIVFSVLAEPVFAFDTNDTHYRFANVISWKFMPELEGFYYEEFNLGDDAGNFYAHVNEVGAVYSGLAPWFDLTVASLHLDEKSNSEWLQQDMPNISGTFKWKLFGYCDMSSKWRIEHVFREKADNGWRHRNVTLLTLPVKLTRYEIQPYFAEEFWYDFEAEYMTLNEFTTGLNMKLFKNLGLTIFCILSDSHSRSPDKWKRTNIMGTRFSWSF